MSHYLAKSGKPIKFSFLLVLLLLPSFLVDAPVEEDFDRSLTECLFYTIPDLPELHYFYEVYHPWPHDKPNWGT